MPEKTDMFQGEKKIYGKNLGIPDTEMKEKFADLEPGGKNQKKTHLGGGEGGFWK